MLLGTICIRSKGVFFIHLERHSDARDIAHRASQISLVDNSKNIQSTKLFFCTVIGHSEDIFYLKWFGYRIHIKFITKTFLSFDLERHKEFFNFKHILYHYCRSFHYFASIFSFLVASSLQYLKDS